MTETLTRSLSDVLSDFRFAMLVTADMTARPLTIQETEGHLVRFLCDSEASWTADADGQQVTLALEDPTGNSFASVTGTARLTHDMAVIERLYGPQSDAFFDGVDDPRLRLLTVEATVGEWWDGPSGRLGTALAVAKAKVTGGHADDVGTIDLT